MEKVVCIKCGSIGYAASVEQVSCSECGDKHKLVRFKRNYYMQYFQKEGDAR